MQFVSITVKLNAKVMGKRSYDRTITIQPTLMSRRILRAETTRDLVKWLLDYYGDDKFDSRDLDYFSDCIDSADVGEIISITDDHMLVRVR